MDMVLEHINSTGKAFIQFAGPMLVQSSILIAILLLADLLIRRKVRAVFRYWLWILVLAKLMLPISLSSPIGMGNYVGDKLSLAEINAPSPVSDPAPAAQTENPKVTIEVPAPPAASRNLDASGNTVRSSEWPRAYSEVEIDKSKIRMLPAALPKQVPDGTATLTWQGCVFLFWFAIASAMLLLLLQRAVFVAGLIAQADDAGADMTENLEHCRKQMKIKQNIRLKISPNATSPAVCGLFRPVILLPKNLERTLDSDTAKAVLFHELAHIKRADLWVNLLQALLQIFYFYNPLLWLANACIRRIREQAVDEAVLVAMGEKAQQYPEILLNVAKLAFKRPAMSLRLIGVVESKSALTQRIKHILTRPLPKTAKLGIAGLIAIIITGAILLPMAKAASKQPEFIIKGTVTDAETGQPIAGAKVGDNIEYSDKFYTFTDSNGHYEYKTWYEEHFMECRAAGYKTEKKIILTKLFGSEKEKVIDFALVPAAFITAEQVMKQADSEARLLNHEYVGTEHILMALAGEKSGKIAQIFAASGIDEGKIHGELMKCVKKGIEPVTKRKLSQTPRANLALKNAAKWAKAYNSDTVKPEYVLLGLLQVEDGVGAQVLMNLGLNLEKAQEAITSDITVEGSHELLMERRDILQKMLQNVEQKYNTGMADFRELGQAKIDLLQVESELAESPQKRIEILGQIVDIYKDQEKNIKKLSEAGRASQDELGKAKLLRLEAEAELARAKTVASIVEVGLMGPEPGHYATFLPNGVTVELVGITNYPSKNQPWWKPDGTVLADPPYDGSDSDIMSMIGKDIQKIELAIKLGGNTAVPAWEVPIKRVDGEGLLWAGRRSKNGQFVNDIKSVAIICPSTQEKLSLRLSIAAGQWENVATAIKNTVPEAFNEIVFSVPQQTTNGATITVSDSLLEYDSRIVAVNLEDKIHTCSRRNRSVEITGNIRQTMATFDVDLSKIKEFQFQTRPYQWVEFKNVSLKPNFKTDVQIEVEKLTEVIKPDKQGERESQFITLLVATDSVIFNGKDVKNYEELALQLQAVPDRNKIVLQVITTPDFKAKQDFKFVKNIVFAWGREYGYKDVTFLDEVGTNVQAETETNENKAVPITIDAKVYSVQLDGNVLGEFLKDKIGVAGISNETDWLGAVSLTDEQAAEFSGWIQNIPDTLALANPKLKVFDGEEAELSISGGSAIEPQSGPYIKIKLQPKLSKDKSIVRLKFRFEKKQTLIAADTEQAKEPTVSSQLIETTVAVPNGKNVLMPVGGIIDSRGKNRQTLLLVKASLGEDTGTETPAEQIERKEATPREQINYAPADVQEISKVLKKWFEGCSTSNLQGIKKTWIPEKVEKAERDLRTMQKLLNLNPGWEFALLAVYWNEDKAMAVSKALKYGDPKVGGPMVLVWTLERQNGSWLLSDIDLEELEGLQIENSRFMQNHPDADVWFDSSDLYAPGAKQKPTVQAEASALVEWPVAQGGNGHFYEPVAAEAITWNAAGEAAQQAGGYLVTITSQSENEFVYNLIKDKKYWYDDTANLIGPWIGAYQPPRSPEPDGNWQWVTGESFEYSNWGSGRPNNSGGREDYAHFGIQRGVVSTWNDLPGDSAGIRSYIIEYEPIKGKAKLTYNRIFEHDQLDPGQVVETFLTALQAGEYKAAEKFTKPGSNAAANLQKVRLLIEKKIPAVAEYQINGDIAVAWTYAVLKDSDGNEDVFNIVLVRENNLWLITEIDLQSKKIAEPKLEQFRPQELMQGNIKGR